MPGPFPMLREAALALFLIAVALGLWLADVRPLAVVGVMAIALAVAWVIEWISWSEDQLQRMQPAREEVQPIELPAEAAVPAPAPTPAPRARGLWLLRARSAPTAPEPEQTREEVPAETVEEVGAGPAEPVASPTIEPEQAAEPPKPEAPPEEAPPPEEPPPSRRRLQPVRSAAPPPPPPPPAAPPQPPEAAPVVPLWARSTEPREWNLWDLERIARAQSRRDPERFEEWSYLFLHLRRFANADGMLPAEFDGLIRDSFGGLLEPAQGA